jgi:ATP-binding cassette subfamily C exporter for protease/lipase
MSQGQQGKPRSELSFILWRMRHIFINIGIFSFFINLLHLVPTIYMFQIYDRVLTSRNEVTLWTLTIIMLGMFFVQGTLEWVRSDMLVQAGLRLDRDLHARVFTASFEQSLRHGGGSASQALTDLTNVRQFLTGSGLLAFFDAPWGLMFLGVVFMLHPMLGAMATFGMIVGLVLNYLTEVLTGKPLMDAQAAWMHASSFANGSLRNAEVVSAMGMLDNLRGRWYQRYRKMLYLQALASNRAGTISTLGRSVRMALQSLVLGFGALLVLDASISPAAMIVASILMGRAVMPIEMAVSGWKMFVMSRDAYARLRALLEDFPEKPAAMALPAPKGEIRVEGLVAVAPGGGVPILRNVSFMVPVGSVVAVIGPSAAGKSTLARLLVGIWPPYSGNVRLDGVDIYGWNKLELGPHIGYLPQNVELFEGSIADNISRYGDMDPERVVAAAQLTGLHEIILRFPQGYDTQIGDGGSFLSGGQKQRIGLARAVYNMPALVVLDEPNSNLDDVGEAALVETMRALKQAGRTVVVVTHRTNVLGVVDRILLLREGQLAAYGPRDEVLAALRGAALPQPVAPAQVAAPQDAQRGEA